ncbi:hypothetical protein A4X09_0g2221 [Tilletia walkeri]|uniref:DUF803-domain-containing protein n=1 Tax=Tilletia walkeri TaxID=117179 RepID=A0A8X7T5V2_9BASI|nr:hypothetical protein A4X09_0g2221 [Tilletia walkeri]
MAAPLILLQQTWLEHLSSSLSDMLSPTSASAGPASVGKRPAFIGIVIAITANIIISVALNVQKMAHIRLQQEQQQQEYDDEHEHDDDEDGFDDQDGFDDEEEEEEEEEEEGKYAGNRRFRVQVDTIQEESESPLASARTSQHLTPRHGMETIAQSEASSSSSSPNRTSQPGSPSPAPRSKLTDEASHSLSAQPQSQPQSQSQERSGSSTEVDSTPSPPSQSKSKLLDVEYETHQPTTEDDDDDGDDDESQPLLLSRRSSHQAPSSTNPRPGPNTKFLRSRLWWCGIGLMTLGEAGNFISYGFAPASLVAPLGAVALLSNVIIAPILLHERFRLRDLGGIFLAILGAVTVVFSSRQDDPALGPDALWDAIRRSVFLIYMTVVLSLGAVFAALSLTRLGDQFVLLDVGTCAIFGGFTVLSTKGISSMLSAGPSPFELFRHPITYILAFVLASTAVLQITFLNRALQRFDSRQVIPTMFTLFTIMAIVGSAVLYRDFEDMDAHRLINFLFGCGTTFAGVFLLTRRHDDDDDDDQGEARGSDGNMVQGEEAARDHREVLGDVQEEEEGGEVDDDERAGVQGGASSVDDKLILGESGALVAEPDALSIQSSAIASSSHQPTAADLIALPVRRPVPEHTQSSPTPIPSLSMAVGTTAAAAAASYRRGRTTTALDGTGTAFLAAGSPPGMLFALGSAGVGAGVRGASPGRPGLSNTVGVIPVSLEGGVASPGGNNVVVGSATSNGMMRNSSAMSVPVTPGRAGAASGATTTTGGGLLPLYRTPRLSFVGGSSSNAAGGGGPTPSASISALSTGQLLLLATPTPSAVPIVMPSSSSTHGHGHGLGIGYASGTGGMARSLPPGADGVPRSRALSQPSTPVPRRRSRKALRAEAAAQAQVQTPGGRDPRERERSESRGRENYAKGQGSWTERRRPVSGVGVPSGSGMGVGSSATAVAKQLPQRRSVISLFGGWSGSGSGAAQEGSQVPPLSPPLVRSQSQTQTQGTGQGQGQGQASTTTRPGGMIRNDSSRTSPPDLFSSADVGTEEAEASTSSRPLVSQRDGDEEGVEGTAARKDDDQG